MTVQRPTAEDIRYARLQQAHRIATAHDQHNPDGFAWSQAYLQDVSALTAEATDILARLSAADQERDETQLYAQRRVVAAQAAMLAAERSARAAEAREEALKVALRRYGMHKRDCYDGWQPGEDNPESCSCGLAAALAGREEPK